MFVVAFLQFEPTEGERVVTKNCDNTSVGVLVFRDTDAGRELLLIERKKYPPGLAAPAGHVDDHGSFEAAARAELQEEVGLTAQSLALIDKGRMNNPCRRPGGDWHYWCVYMAAVSGNTVSPSATETKGYLWVAREVMEDLLAGGAITREDSNGHPQEVTLEPVWRDIFEKVGILQMF